MKLLFLGAGSAFTVGKKNFQSNVLLQSSSGRNLLIDCGSDIRHSLYESGFTHLDINDVYVSHLHADHVGGLEWLAFVTKFDPKCQNKPNLFVSDNLIDDLWDHVLSGGLASLQNEKASLSTYFKVHPVKQNSGFDWEHITFDLVQTVHVMNNVTLAPSFGLFFKIGETAVFFTTDTQLALPQLITFYEKSNIIFHDCETSENKSGVHARYDDLKNLDEKFKRKMWLYHYNPGKLPNAKKEGFLGFVKKGQVFHFPIAK